MTVSKFKSVRHDFHEGAGPSMVTTLGIVLAESTHILGSFYEGPAMDPDDTHRLARLEAEIDGLVARCQP